jgi:hypothetical protein
MFSPSTSFAGWKKVGEDVYGDTHYVDLRESKTRWYVYFWFLNDYLKPTKYGDDCL